MRSSIRAGTLAIIEVPVLIELASNIVAVYFRAVLSYIEIMNDSSTIILSTVTPRNSTL